MRYLYAILISSLFVSSCRQLSSNTITESHVAKLVKEMQLLQPNRPFNLQLNFSGDNVDELSISNYWENFLPASLTNFKKLKSIYFYNTELVDTLDFSYYPDLWSIRLGNSKISQLPFLQKINKVSFLEITACSFKGNIYISENFINIQHLDFGYNKIEDVNFYQSELFRDLTYLDLRNNEIIVLSESIYLLPHLHELNLSGNPLSDLDLHKFKELRNLTIDKELLDNNTGIRELAKRMKIEITEV